MKKSILYLFLTCLSLIPLTCISQDGNIFSGSYEMITEEAVLTLTLKQQAGSLISGTLTSTSGISYSLEGSAEGNTASGTCSDDYGSVFFELYAEADELILSLIEPDAWGMPDYNTTVYLTFKETHVEDQLRTNNDNSMNTSGNVPQQGEPGSSNSGVGNPYWNFQFIPPEGWVYQQTDEGMVLGHTTIPGVILIFPHSLENIEAIRQEMLKGIQEGYDYLTLSSEITTADKNILAGDYDGLMEGQQAKARGFATLSPFGGGAFILAVSTPRMLGDEIKRDAEWIASNLIYKKMETSGLVQHFTGRWANFTTNTSNWIYLYPDGSYDEQYESSYSGELDGGGNWGAYGEESARGRWSIQGNKDQGRIIVKLADGDEIYYDYSVHEERGQKYYAEYWFNGKLYSKSQE